MPAWIENVLRVSGNGVVLDSLVAAVKPATGSAALSFRTITPPPPEYDENGAGSYLDSDEFLDAVRAANRLRGDELRDFLAANAGVAQYRATEPSSVRLGEDLNCIVWRLQHWGATVDVDDHSGSDRADDGALEPSFSARPRSRTVTQYGTSAVGALAHGAKNRRTTTRQDALL